jgi:circadian clock protein KaiC
VILLDNRVEDQIATRRLRVVKYRGSSHGTNEFPFLIEEDGISVLPITAPRRNLAVCNEIISSGIPGLDAMIRNGGFYRGSTILVSGVSGTGKTTVATHFANAACLRGERCSFFSFEESAEEICRNARSVGLDLQAHVEAGLLRFEWARPSLYGLEMHLARMQRDIETFKPTVVVIDAISAFRGPVGDVHSVLMRTVDLLKSSGITAMFTSLRGGASQHDGTDQGLSSIMDSWIKLKDVEENGERNRILFVVKSRGTSHSKQLREFRMTDSGIELIDAYIGPEGVLTGTARITQEARDQAATDQRAQDIKRRQRQLSRRRESVKRQIEELQAALQADEDEENMLLGEDDLRDKTLKSDRAVRAASRSASE